MIADRHRSQIESVQKLDHVGAFVDTGHQGWRDRITGKCDQNIVVVCSFGFDDRSKASDSTLSSAFFHAVPGR